MAANTFFFNWEVDLLIWLQAHAGSVIIKIAKLMAYFGDEFVMIALLGFLYWCWDKELGRFLGTGMAMGIVAGPMIKNTMLRKRPYMDHDRIACYKPVAPDAGLYDISAQGYSFPSMHSSNSTIMFGSLIWGGTAKWYLRLPAILMPVLVGVSRCVVGVHYPTDVLAGWILGLVILYINGFLNKRFEHRGRVNLVIFLLSLTGIFFCRSEDYFTGLGVMAGYFLSIPFEERFVHFDNTRNPVKMMLRLAGGFGLFFGISYLLKKPFSEEFLETAELASFMVRFLRYAIVSFVVLGVYPILFRPDRLKSEMD